MDWSREQLRFRSLRPTLISSDSASSVRFDSATGSWRAMQPLETRRRLPPRMGIGRGRGRGSLRHPGEEEEDEEEEPGRRRLAGVWRVLDEEERGVGSWRRGHRRSGDWGLESLSVSIPCSRLHPTVRLQVWDWEGPVDLSQSQRGLIAANVRLRNDNSLAFSRDGHMVAAMTGAEITDMRLECLSLRDLDRGRVLYKLDLGPAVLACLAFSPTDSHLLVGLLDSPDHLGLAQLSRPFARAFRLQDRDEVVQPPHSRKRCSAQSRKVGELKPVLNLKRSGAGIQSRLNSAELSGLLWLRTPGLGFLYASRRGSLTLIGQRLSEDAGPSGAQAGSVRLRPPLPQLSASPILAVVSSLRRRLELQSSDEDDEETEPTASLLA